MLTHAGREHLDRILSKLIDHDSETADVLEQLVEDFHDHPLLVPYQLVNHYRFEEMMWGILKILNVFTPENPRVSGNAVYIIGALLEIDVGRKKLFRLLATPGEHRNEAYHLLPNTAAILTTDEDEPMINSSGTLSLLVESPEGVTWTLSQPSLDWVVHIIAELLTGRNLWIGSNCALTLARLCLRPDGCLRIFEHNDFDLILTQLIRSLGVDKQGRGMNAAFALAYLCDLETALKIILSNNEADHMLQGLNTMLSSTDVGCRKNACFVLKNIASKRIGQEWLTNSNDIDKVLRMLSILLTSNDEETATFAAIALRNISDEVPGYLKQKDHPDVKPTLQEVLSRNDISDGYREKARDALDALLLRRPNPPKLQVLDAHSIVVRWDPIVAKSGLDIIYELYMGEELVFRGPQRTFTVKNLKERQQYEFKIQGRTQEDEESPFSNIGVATTTRAVSGPPKGLRAVSITSSATTLRWDPPDTLYGVLKGYLVTETGNNLHYEPKTCYHVASNLKPDTEYTFNVCAVTKRGKGQKAIITIRTLRFNHYAPSKPELTGVGMHEIGVKWEPPLESPNSRINGYEVKVNKRRVYYGMKRSCLVKMLQPDTLYSFTVTAWTNEGRAESQPANKRTPPASILQHRRSNQSKEELVNWLEIHDPNHKRQSPRKLYSTRSTPVR